METRTPRAKNTKIQSSTFILRITGYYNPASLERRVFGILPPIVTMIRSAEGLGISQQDDQPSNSPNKIRHKGILGKKAAGGMKEKDTETNRSGLIEAPGHCIHRSKAPSVEIAAWFTTVLGMRDPKEVNDFTTQAIHDFQLSSAREVEAQFKPWHEANNTTKEWTAIKTRRRNPNNSFPHAEKHDLPRKNYFTPLLEEEERLVVHGEPQENKIRMAHVEHISTHEGSAASKEKPKQKEQAADPTVEPTTTTQILMIKATTPVVDLWENSHTQNHQ